MKQLLYLLFAVMILSSCSSDDNPVIPPLGDTSFIVTIDSPPSFTNCIAGYKSTDGTYIKIGDLGTLSRGKYSPEIKINNDLITDIYIFTDYNGVIRFDEKYRITKNAKNTITVAYNTKGVSITDKKDPKQYPQ